MFKSKIASLAIFAALTAASSIATANVITFDELATNADTLTIANGYQGFNWSNFGVLNGQQYNSNSGYTHGTVSGTNVAYNWYNNLAAFSSDTAFTLNDLYITKAWYAGVTHIAGYVGSTLTFSQDISSSTTSPTLATLNWTGLNRVTFSDGNNTFHSVLDNIRVNEAVAPVPEPETYALMGLGLVGLLAARRRKAK